MSKDRIKALEDALRDVIDGENWRAGKKFDPNSSNFDLSKQRAALAASQTAPEPWGWHLRDLTATPEKLGIVVRERDRLAIAQPPEEWEVTPLYAALEVQPLTVQDAARRILSDDIAISHMAQALHDGPLGADDYWFSAARPQGAWCVDAVRVVLRAIVEGK